MNDGGGLDWAGELACVQYSVLCEQEAIRELGLVCVLSRVHQDMEE